MGVGWAMRFYRVWPVLAFLAAWSGCGGEPAGEKLVRLAQKEGKVFTYGMGDYWGSYKLLMDRFQELYGIRRLDLDMSSARTVARLEYEGERSAMDTGIVGITYVPPKEKGLLGCYRSVHDEFVPDWAKDQTSGDCRGWYATYYGTVVIGVNAEVMDPVPQGFKDLLDPAYKGKIVIMDPRHSATGFASVMAAVYALGGDMDNLEPGLDFIRQLKQRGHIAATLRSQNLDAFVGGQYPVYFNYDYNFVKLREETGADIRPVVPQEGTIRYAYVNLIPRKPVHPHATRLLIDFMLSEEGQRVVASAYTRPVREDVKLPPKIAARLPSQDQVRVFDPDWSKADKAVEAVKAAWDEIFGG